MAVDIVVDSASDLTPTHAAEAGIDMVPCLVRFGTQEFRDGVDIPATRFYEKLQNNGQRPVTAPPPVEAFLESFGNHVRAGKDVVCITVASGVSKTHANACEAARSFAGKVRVIDSRTLSGGEALLAMAAARMARSGAGADAIEAQVQKWIATQQGYAIYGDIDFLASSGRINRHEILLGTAMHLVPITRVNAQGILENETTVKSWDQAKHILVGIVARRLERPANAHVAVAHANAPELAAFLDAELRGKIAAAPKELTTLLAGPTIGANLGPGFAGIFMFEER
ncbi:MAG TPA: DegV family protein [Candidatus Baltobacteraceae bacterium]|jgi:DegV family protein with EDD domain|nr:DegV family protein [Candidatus Baltobacteraceae bacterium]